jgi:hypothetical protein
MFLTGKPASSSAQAQSPLPPLPTAALLQQQARQVIREIAPVWPLQRFVAVNPLAAHHTRSLADVAADLADLLDADLYPDPVFFQKQFTRGQLTQADLDAVGQTAPLSELLVELRQLHHDQGAKPSTASQQIFDQLPQHGYRLIQSNAAKWFSSLLVDSAAHWSLHQNRDKLIASWQALIAHDYSLDLLGFRRLRQELKRLNTTAEPVFEQLQQTLAQSTADFDTTLRQLAYRNYGWLAFARFLDREHGGDDKPHSLALQLLTIQASYELARLRAYPKYQPNHQPSSSPDVALKRQRSIAIRDSLLRAVEQQARRPLAQDLLAQKTHSPNTQRARFQAVFCIDVRSEGIRRQLERLSSEIQTVGFAGFFGLALNKPSRFGSPTPRCPVILEPTIDACESHDNTADNSLNATVRKSKKLLSTMFSYVEAFGLGYLPVLVHQLFGAKAKPKAVPAAPLKLTATGTQNPLDLATKVTISRQVLKHSGLMGNLGRLVLICGHGASSPNNPYASALDCGACGGHPGDDNARALCQILNDPDVRQQLEGSPWEIPADTWFIAGLHNTTTGVAQLLGATEGPNSHAADIAALEELLKRASGLANLERASLENRSSPPVNAMREAANRAGAISEIRPEWGLARNAFFIAASRDRTAKLNLEGRAFLHDYKAAHDTDGATLELILTGPLLVAHWINMQYYVSTVEPQHFGSGSKLLHSAMGSSGVLEGTDHELRVGLPWQSVHDGKDFVHEPIRLQAFIEASPQAIDRVLLNHKELPNLVSHGWLTLLALDPQQNSITRCLRPGHWVHEAAT